jgi:nitroimidazol reductase NimA-like FMN-containing flavoprotein (pyridoxamine 5'-phosphate oxidase superfamily)
MADRATLEDSSAAEDYCYITTTGRVSGKPHTIEIWFGYANDTIYILAGGGERSDTVRNGRKQPRVRVKIGEREYRGVMRAVEDAEEDALARRLLLEKYAPGYAGDLSDWGKNALPVAIDLQGGSG